MAARMEPGSRTRLIALAVLLVVSVPLVLVAASGGGDGEREPGSLKVERSPGGLPEITVYVEDPALNVPEAAGGASQVTIECVDRAGKVVFAEAHRWPFTDTDKGVLDPHQHLGMDPAVLEQVARCRLKGTDPPIEGRLA